MVIRGSGYQEWRWSRVNWRIRRPRRSFVTATSGLTGAKTQTSAPLIPFHSFQRFFKELLEFKFSSFGWHESRASAT